MNHRISIWKQLAIAAATIGGVLFGFVTSVIWLALLLDRLPLLAWNSGGLVALIICALIAGTGVSCWMCGARAQKWAQRRFDDRNSDSST